MIRFSEILDLSEPTYTRHLIGGEQKTKDRKTSIFNEGTELCRGLFEAKKLDFPHPFWSFFTSPNQDFSNEIRLIFL